MSALLADSLAPNTGAGGTDVQLTTGWGVNAAYEHFWTKAWRTSLYGGYEAISYNAVANASLCVAEGPGNGTGGFGTAAVAAAGCNNNWSFWYLGSRTQWDVTADTYLGLDVAYGALTSATALNGILPANVVSASSAAGPTTATVGNTGIWTARFRVHKDFYP